jgi:hypothetical protein
MISRVMRTLTELSEGIQEYAEFLENDLKKINDKPMDLLNSYTPLARFIMNLRCVNVPALFLDIYLENHRKVYNKTNLFILIKILINAIISYNYHIELE